MRKERPSSGKYTFPRRALSCRFHNDTTLHINPHRRRTYSLTMTRIPRYLCVLFVLVLFFQAASGSIAVKDLTISPAGNLISGQDPPEEVRVAFGITFFPEGGETFPNDDTLHMNTDLENAKWSYIKIQDGFPSPPTVDAGKNLNIQGWDLSYPKSVTMALAVNLTGTVPAVTSSGKKTVLRVTEGSASGVVPGSEFIREANVVLSGSSPLHSTTVTETPTPAVQTTVPTPSQPVQPAGGPDSVAISGILLTLVILLISFIPLGLLVFHDHFGLGRMLYPVEDRQRMIVSAIQAVCGIGLILALLTLQKMFGMQAGSGNGTATIITLVTLFLVSYLALSALAFAVGTFINRAFVWTIRIHQVVALLVLVLSPVVLILYGKDLDPAARTTAMVVAPVAALVSGITAVWLDRSLNDELGRDDWVARVFDLFRRTRHRTAPLQEEESPVGSALAILNTRLAKGEITLEEYNQMKDAIRK